MVSIHQQKKGVYMTPTYMGISSGSPWPELCSCAYPGGATSVAEESAAENVTEDQEDTAVKVSHKLNYTQ